MYERRSQAHDSDITQSMEQSAHCEATKAQLVKKLPPLI